MNPDAKSTKDGKKTAGAEADDGVKRPTDGGSSPEEATPGDLRMARALWPVLLASVVSLLPFTVFSTYLVPIAEETGSSVAATGGLRGLGGLAALLVGTALAPLIDRVPRESAAAAGLGVLAVSAALGAGGEFVLLAAFCLLVGAGTSVLNPALTAAAADRFGGGRAAGRAATLVTATQSMTAMLAAPLIALPAAFWGWQGDLLAVAGISALLAWFLHSRRGKRQAGRRGSGNGRANGCRDGHGDGHGDEPGREPRDDHAPPDGRPGRGQGDGHQEEQSSQDRGLGYLASFRALAAIPGVSPLLCIALLRTAVFMGYLAHLAAYYDQRFQLDPGTFSLVWTLSGASFFVSNLLTGRITNSASPRISTERLLAVGLFAALISVTGFYLTHSLPTALLLTALHAASHAVVAACVVSLLVRRCGPLRGSALSINAAGMSFGVFAGAALGGAGLGLAGYAGTAAVFGTLTAVALCAAFLVVRRDATAQERP